MYLSSRRTFTRALLATTATTACGPVRGKVTRTVDGKRVTEEVVYENYREFFKSVGRMYVDPWIQIGKALAAAMKELRRVIREMIKEILRVPEPGVVALADLDPAFASLSGTRYDYVGDDRFTYVRLDVPAFDGFFKASMELFAYTTQLVRSSEALRHEVGLRQGHKEASQLRVRELVTIGARTDSLDGLTGAVEASLGPSTGYRDQVASLRTSGTALVASAKQTLIDPRVIAHVDLVIKGVKQSLEVLAETAKLFVELFKKPKEA